MVSESGSKCKVCSCTQIVYSFTLELNRAKLCNNCDGVFEVESNNYLTEIEKICHLLPESMGSCILQKYNEMKSEFLLYLESVFEIKRIYDQFQSQINHTFHKFSINPPDIFPKIRSNFDPSSKSPNPSFEVGPSSIINVPLGLSESDQAPAISETIKQLSPSISSIPSLNLQPQPSSEVPKKFKNLEEWIDYHFHEQHVNQSQRDQFIVAMQHYFKQKHSSKQIRNIDANAGLILYKYNILDLEFDRDPITTISKTFSISKDNLRDKIRHSNKDGKKQSKRDKT